MGQFKDLFSAHSNDYAKFRPTYPATLFDYLATLTPPSSTVWDCGTGSGQAAIELASRFQKVFATDPSEKQLTNAMLHPNIKYSVATAENSKLDSHSIDLITVAQAFHWFNHEQFFNEVRRVSKPGATLAIWSYALAMITPEIDVAVMDLYQGLLESYWEPERKLVATGYATIPVPFPELLPEAAVIPAPVFFYNHLRV